MEISLEHTGNGYTLHFEGLNYHALFVSVEDMTSYMTDEELLNVEDVDPSHLASTYNEYEIIVDYVNQPLKVAA